MRPESHPRFRAQSPRILGSAPAAAMEAGVHYSSVIFRNPYPRTPRKALCIHQILCIFSGILGGDSAGTTRWARATTPADEFGIPAAWPGSCQRQSVFRAIGHFALQQVFMQPASAASTASARAASTSNPLAQAFQQLSSDLKSATSQPRRKVSSTIQAGTQREFSDHLHHAHHVGTGWGLQNRLGSQATQDLSSGTCAVGKHHRAQSYARLAQQLQQYKKVDAAGSASSAALLNPILVDSLSTRFNQKPPPKAWARFASLVTSEGTTGQNEKARVSPALGGCSFQTALFRDFCHFNTTGPFCALGGAQ